MYTNQYVSTNQNTVALLYPSTFSSGQGFSSDYLKIIYFASHRLLHTCVPLLPQKQCQGLSEPKASMEAFIFAVLTSSQHFAVFHPVCLMDLTGWKSWHLLQKLNQFHGRPASWQPLSLWVLFNHKLLSDWLFQLLRRHSHQSCLSLFTIKEWITYLLFGCLGMVTLHFCLCFYSLD